MLYLLSTEENLRNMTPNLTNTQEETCGWDLLKDLWLSFKKESSHEFNSKDNTIDKIRVICKTLAYLPPLTLLSGCVCAASVFHYLTPLKKDDTPIYTPEPSSSQIPSIEDMLNQKFRGSSPSPSPTMHRIPPHFRNA